MQGPTPHRIPYTPVQQNPWPMWYYPGPGGGGNGVDWIKFTLDADIDTNATGDVTITETSNPAYPVSATVTVSNETGAYGMAGSTGQALLIGGAWIAFIIDTPSQFIVATATSHSHSWTGSTGSPSTSMPAAVSTLTIGTPTFISEWPSSNQQITGLPIANPHNFYWRSGALLTLMHVTRGGRRLEVVNVNEQPLQCKFRLTADVGTGTIDPATAAVCTIPFAQGTMQTTISVKDRYYLMHNAKSGDSGIAMWNLGDSTWECISCEHVATELKGTMGFGDGTNAFTGTPANISFSDGNYTGLNGRTPTGTLTVQNRFGWERGPTGGDVFFKWDQISGVYFAVQMDCPT